MSTGELLTVLVVEDEPGIRGILATLLHEEGYGVLEASTGLDAVRLVDGARRQNPPCLILLDMTLPGLDGLGVLAHVHQRGDGIPVVAMSANRDRLAAAEEAGAAASLCKPFDLDDVVAILDRYCHPPA